MLLYMQLIGLGIALKVGGLGRSGSGGGGGASGYSLNFSQSKNSFYLGAL